MTLKENPPELIVGLGNPENTHLKTRHNIGFWFIDSLTKHLNILLQENSAKGISHCEYTHNYNLIKLIKPMTYINDSGTPLKAFIKNTNITPNKIIVAYDDLDLPAGKIKFRFSGGSGGHNGIKDIIEKLGTKDFWRLKIGIGKPVSKEDVISYVLGRPSPEDKELIYQSINIILDNSSDLLSGSYSKFMNKFNGDNNGL